MTQTGEELMLRGEVDSSSVTISDFKDLEQTPLLHTIYRVFIFMASPAGEKPGDSKGEEIEAREMRRARVIISCFAGDFKHRFFVMAHFRRFCRFAFSS